MPDGWIGVGGAIVAGVLTEPPDLARAAVTYDVSAPGEVSFASSATLGPTAAALGPLGACAIFDAAEDGTMLYSATLPGLAVAAGQLITFPTGIYAMTSAGALDAGVLLLNGKPLRVNGIPLRIG